MLRLRWYTDPETDVDRNGIFLINSPQPVHLTLHATFHSFSPLNVQETDKTHKVGVARCRKVITVEIAKNRERECVCLKIHQTVVQGSFYMLIGQEKQFAFRGGCLSRSFFIFIKATLKPPLQRNERDHAHHTHSRHFHTQIAKNV